jgi:hypothetical protein
MNTRALRPDHPTLERVTRFGFVILDPSDRLSTPKFREGGASDAAYPNIPV